MVSPDFFYGHELLFLLTRLRDVRRLELRIRLNKTLSEYHSRLIYRKTGPLTFISLYLGTVGTGNPDKAF